MQIQGWFGGQALKNMRSLQYCNIYGPNVSFIRTPHSYSLTANYHISATKGPDCAVSTNLVKDGLDEFYCYFAQNVIILLIPGPVGRADGTPQISNQSFWGGHTGRMEVPPEQLVISHTGLERST